MSSSSIAPMLAVVGVGGFREKHTFDFVFANVDECRRLHYVASEIKYHFEAFAVVFRKLRVLLKGRRALADFDSVWRSK
jgi:hypothetical protein